MLPAVVVDLGPDVGRAQVEIVLQACNHAISRGVCVAPASGGDEAPRAVAVARASDRSVLVVRIEVRLGSDQDASIVRELRFARRDPVAERWRSVGLAIATLVGEGEQRALEEGGPAVAAPPEPAAPEPAPAEPGAAEPAPAEPPPAEPGATVPGATEPRAAEPARAAAATAGTREVAEPPEPPPPPPEPLVRREAREPEVVLEPTEPEPPLDWSHRPLFIGVSALVGSGFEAGSWRAGGGLRGVWHFPGGLALLVAGSYSRGAADSFDVAWLTLDAGVGYRFALSERVSLGAWLLAGAEREQVEAVDVSHAETLLSPRLGLAADVWWRAAPMFGLWAALEGTTTFRETRLFEAPGSDPIRSLPVGAALSVGLAVWLR